MTFTETRVVRINQQKQIQKLQTELTDKNGKTTAIVLFPVIKSVEENKDVEKRNGSTKKDPTETYKVKNEVFKVKYTLVEVNSILETEEKVTELENIAI